MSMDGESRRLNFSEEQHYSNISKFLHDSTLSMDGESLRLNFSEANIIQVYQKSLIQHCLWMVRAPG